MADLNSVVQTLAAAALPVLFAVTVHEVAHGWMAQRLGDRTAQMLGRLTLNPIRHIDPFGTVIVPAVSILIGGFAFGWAKPVPVTPENLRNPKRDMAWVAAAGPMSNLLMALVWTAVGALGVAVGGGSFWGAPLQAMAHWGIYFNAMLFALNLLPLPPLDGGRIAVAILPRRAANALGQLEPYGIIIVLGLLIVGALGMILLPIVLGIYRSLAQIAGL